MDDHERLNLALTALQSIADVTSRATVTLSPNPKWGHVVRFQDRDWLTIMNAKQTLADIEAD